MQILEARSFQTYRLPADRLPAEFFTRIVVEVPPSWQDMILHTPKVIEVSIPLPWMYYTIAYKSGSGPVASWAMVLRLGASPTQITSPDQPLYDIPLPHMLSGGFYCGPGLAQCPRLTSVEQIAIAGLVHYWQSPFKYFNSNGLGLSTDWLSAHGMGRIHNTGYGYQPGLAKPYIWWAKHYTPETVCTLPWGQHPICVYQQFLDSVNQGLSFCIPVDLTVALKT